MSYLKNLKWEMVLYSILSIAIGVLMFLYPTKTLNAVCIILAVMLFFIIAVVASYNIGGTIQGFYDKKFRKKIVSGTFSCFLISIFLAIIYMIILGGI